MNKIIYFFILTFLSINISNQLIRAKDSTATSEMTVEKWRHDIRFMVEEMQKVHVNIFHSMTKSELDKFVQELDAKIPTLSDNQIIVELLKIMTMIGDGHTYLIPETIQMFPVRLYEFDDGVFVIRAEGENAGLVGQKLVNINGRNWNEIRESMKDIIPRDNDEWIKSLGPTYAAIGEFMNGLGIIDNVNNMELVTENEIGNRKETIINSKQVSQQEYFHSAHIGDPTDISAPLYLQQPEKFYWLKYLEDSKGLYIKYNVVQFDRDESMKAFCDRIEHIVNTNDVKKIVIDIRNNGGGNNFTSIPFVEFLSNNEKINVYGKLYTILGRQTFSAASFFTSAMENRTNSIFVGEPTGAAPNHYGDNRPVLLPNSKLQPRFSTIYWQNAFVSDKRNSTEPDIKVTLKSSDYFSKRDPVLEEILKIDHMQTQSPKPDEQMKKFLGRYEFSPDQILTINEANGDIVMEITGFYKTVLYPDKNNNFKTSRKNVDVIFQSDNNGDEVIITAGGERSVYKRLPEEKFLTKELLDMNRTSEAVAVLRELKISHPERRSVSETNINVLGYELVNHNKIEAAIEIFKLNVELYPDAFNTYDSLGEAYMNAGNNELAIINYEKSYELNPKNENAKKIVEKLRNK